MTLAQFGGFAIGFSIGVAILAIGLVVTIRCQHRRRAKTREFVSVAIARQYGLEPLPGESTEALRERLYAHLSKVSR